MSSGKKRLLPQEPELTYLKDKTMAEMRPVTKTTIPSTQKRPLHLVKSTFKERNLVFNGWDSMNAQQPRQTQPTFVWKQKTVTQMQTTAVMPNARNTTLVS